jgi:hypothetical protein
MSGRDPQDIHARIVQALKDGPAASKLAAETRMPLSTLLRIQAGMEPRLSQAMKIAEGLGVRLHWLATGEGPMRRDAVPPAPMVSKDDVPPFSCSEPWLTARAVLFGALTQARR